MNEKLHQSMLEDIAKLRSLLSELSTHSVALQVVDTVGPMSGKPRFDILSSPYKQCYYLLGLLLSTPEQASLRDIEDKDWEKCTELLQVIYNYYGSMFFPEDGNFGSKSEEWKTHREIVMPVFLNYHNTARTFASVEQKIETINGIFVIYDRILSKLFGISATTALEVVGWISEKAQQKLDDLVQAGLSVKQAHSLFVERVRDGGQDADAVMESIRSDPEFQANLETFRRADEPWLVRLEELRGKFGEATADTFWRHFVSKRGEPSAYTYPTELNPAETKPLILTADGVAICTLHNVVYDAIAKQMTDALTEDKQSTLTKGFFKHRDKFLELQAEKVFRKLFDSSVSFLINVFESPDAQFEHDLIILWNRRLFIIEAKASPPVEPFRDPDKAYTRLRHHFQGEKSIQEAYNQSERIRSRVLNGNDIPLFNTDGRLIKTIEASEVDKAYCICLTADSFSSLAADLSLLLEKDDQSDYPWAVNIFDLEAFFGALAYRGWGPEKLCEYLDARMNLHGRVFTTDELEIAGVFVQHGTLEPLSSVDGDRVVLSADMSDIFDELYVEQQGGPKADFSTDKRLIVTDVNATYDAMKQTQKNRELTASLFSRYERPIASASSTSSKRRIRHFDPCPCGSGKKYKKCCGR